MKKIADLITLDAFKDSLKIIKSLINQTYLQDVNLILVQEKIKAMSDKDVEDYYEGFVKTELLYSVPYLFSSDIVMIPKNNNSLREYRFLTSNALLLYNAIGILFAKTLYAHTEEIKFGDYNKTYRYAPISYKLLEANNWVITENNRYKKFYNDYKTKIDDLLDVNTVLLKLDIKDYFNTIDHEILIDNMYKYSKPSSLKKFKVSEESREVLRFYFKSLMNKNLGIPQGKNNIASDLLGYLYLLEFDLNVKDICETIAKKYNLNFIGMVRYVDDINIILEFDDDCADDTLKLDAMTEIEQKVSEFLNLKLKLTLNSLKTKRYIIRSEEDKEQVFLEITKNISSPEISNFPAKFKVYNEALNEFTYETANDWKQNEYLIKKVSGEPLKGIYNSNFRNFLFKGRNFKKIKESLNNINFNLITDYAVLFTPLFYNKNKKEDYYFAEEIDKFINNKIKEDLIDKRIINILTHMQIHRLNPKNNMHIEILNKEDIDLLKEKIKQDDYGKYLAVLLNSDLKPTESHHLDLMTIYEKLSFEFNNPDALLEVSRDITQSIYYKLINVVTSLRPKKNGIDSIIQQLKLYVHYYRLSEWDTAFNHFLNVFHEICKYIIGKDKNLKVNEIIKNLYSEKIITLKDETLIRRFFDRRNITVVSHGSQGGVANFKATKKTLEEFEVEIINLMIKIIEKGSLNG